MATTRQIFAKTIAAAIKAQDPTNVNSVGDDTNLDTVLANIAALASLAEPFPVGTPPIEVNIGGALVGMEIAGKTPLQVLDIMLHIEYAPQFDDATASISAKAGTIVEVGTVVPTAVEANFTIGGSTAKATAGNNAYVANGGAATNSIACNVEGTGEAKTTFGNVVYTLTRAYAAGTDVVKTTKGNATNKTASNKTTNIASASVNSNIDATTHVIKAITKTASCTIAFVDAFYANTTAIGTMSKLALTNAASLELEFPAETASAKHSFSIPASYTNVQIQIWNSMAREWQAYAGTFDTSSETKTLADGETTKAYTKYTRNDGQNGATKFKISFTKA